MHFLFDTAVVSLLCDPSPEYCRVIISSLCNTKAIIISALEIQVTIDRTANVQIWKTIKTTSMEVFRIAIK